ncbi:hypothetical protein FA95DRAFT_1339169 [Auriscalpium vulgare]|uniref:Uncharacterized protein n=1 Tax=Auriscalpium vulgare TaxID=40419 RepID=A0ACB8RRT9_9AGAM|nr:hypothetical protein FA95DRAFT_1339169 [Auriscalpium vulgare]
MSSSALDPGFNEAISLAQAEKAVTLGHKLSACGQKGDSLDGSSTPQVMNGGSVGHQLTRDGTASVSNASGVESKTLITQVSSVVYDRIWESDMESLLKDMYNGIQNQQVAASRERRPRVDIDFEPGPVLRNLSLRVQPDRLTTLKRGSIRRHTVDSQCARRSPPLQEK